MKTLESYNWTEIQGLLIAGKYPLVEFLGREEEWSLFRTIAANETFNVRVRFLDGPESLTAWRMLQAAPHPQLINIVDAGHFPLNGATLEYAVLEHWEDTLASVMGERELSGNEAREMLESIVPAIDHLHSLHLVHGKIDPARIVATGDKIKLDVLALELPGLEPSGTRSLIPADDISALGVTLLHCLTRAHGDAATLPEPFAGIVKRCLRPEPAKRPSAAQVLELLHGDYMEPPPAPLSGPASEPEPNSLAVSRTPLLRVAGGLAALTLIAGTLVLHRPSAKPLSTAPTQAAVSPVAHPIVAQPIKQDPPPSPERVWRVVAYTFSQSKDARKKAGRINANWPEAHAEVFSTVLGKSPFLIAIGGRMTMTDAAQFRRRALAHGMPKDTYTQNFNH